MTKRLFDALDVYHDDAAYSAAMNMAIDEALLEYTTNPAIRFYRWQSPALSFGYSGRFTDVASHQAERDLVRRWTGGGIVFHGKDLTYSIAIPVEEPAFGESSMSIYEKIHRALADALEETGRQPVLTAHADTDRGTGVNDARDSCFENPVRADVMIDGKKVAGAAQRRTRRGLLQQGSIQGVDLENGLARRFVQALSPDYNERKLDDKILNRARELAEQKYSTDAWLLKR